MSSLLRPRDSGCRSRARLLPSSSDPRRSPPSVPDASESTARRGKLTSMDLRAWVDARGGIVRTTELRERGASSRQLSEAFASGALLRPRRGWAAIRTVDRALFGAAQAGVVLTCVTQAERLGLWVLERGAAHVAAHTHSGGVRMPPSPPMLVHWGRPIVPRDPASLVDPVENVLAYAAGCLPHEQAQIIWESALDKRLVELSALRCMPFRGRAVRLLNEVSPYSGSGLETVVPLRLRWLKVRIVPQAWIDGHRVDFLIGERLVLQVDGGTHVGAQRDSDIAHDARLMLSGYHVIRVSYRQVIDDWPGVQQLIMRAVAQGLHLDRARS